MVHGVIIVRKEKGMTSFGVVSRMRRIFDQKKIGHTGTLDPDAEGVLPVCLGKATRLVEQLSHGTKTYRAVLLLGTVTDTQDVSGKILETREVNVTEEEVRSVLMGFTGKQMQLPPMYSALKVGGKKLVDLAREGREVERKEREVHGSPASHEDGGIYARSGDDSCAALGCKKSGGCRRDGSLSISFCASPGSFLPGSPFGRDGSFL